MHSTLTRTLILGALLALPAGALVAAPAPKAKPKASAKPAAESHGLDLAGMDRTVKPGDDFYSYADGGWMKATEIPADRSSYGAFAILREQAGKRTVDLIQNASKSNTGDAKKIADFYAAFMDEKTIEEKGMRPIAAELAAIDAIGDKAALARFIGTQLRADVDPLNNAEIHTSRLFGIWVSPDFADPKHNVGYLLQGGLGMPDRDNYLATDEQATTQQKQYQQHIAATLKLAKLSDPEARAARVYELERRIAEAHATRTESAEVQNARRWPLAEFAINAPGFAWSEFFAGAGLSKQAHAYVWQPKAFTAIAAQVAAEPLDAWKDYLKFQAIDRAAPYLSSAFADERFRFHGTAMTGAPQQRERWKRGVDATNGALGSAVGRLYAARYFPPESKAAAQKMVKEIIAAFGKRVESLDWMSAETKAKAKAKLSTIYVGIGYPDRWTDYSNLVIKRDDALGNVERGERFNYHEQIAKLDKPVDKTEWWMTPQTVNAVNLPLQNALNFPAAILNPPFFDAKADPVVNFGGIGTVIGHEISHSFDDQGALFDAEGRLANWWTKEDFAHFNEAGNRLAAQYDTYEPLPGIHLSGKLTLGENIADVAGVAAAYDGYRMAYGGREAPTKHGLTGDQQFFLSFAQIWRTKTRPEALRNSLMTNGHAPGMFRAFTVRNIDAWYKAFDVKPGETLYLEPATRVRIW
jgi:putative endopeptidase